MINLNEPGTDDLMPLSSTVPARTPNWPPTAPAPDRNIQQEYEAQRRALEYDRISKLYIDEKEQRRLANNPQMRTAMQNSLLGEALPRVASNAAYLGWQLGHKVPAAGYEAARDAFAKQKFNKDRVTDDEFYGLVQDEFQQRQNLTTALRELPGKLALGRVSTGLAGEPESDTEASWGAYQAWKEQNAELLANLPPEWEFAALQAMNQVRQDTEELIGQTAGISREAWLKLLAWTRPEDAEGVEPVDRDQIVELARKLTVELDDDERDRVFTTLYMAAEASGPGMGKGFFEKVAEGMARGGIKLYDDAAMTIDDRAARDNLARLQSDEPVYERPDGNVFQAKDFMLTGGQLASGLNTPVSPAPSYDRFSRMSDANTPVTPERRQELIEQNEQRIKELTTLRQVRQLAEGVIDPLKTELDGILGRVVQGAYDYSQSISYTAMAAVPYVGFPAVAYSLGNSNYLRMLDEYPDIDPDFAFTLSMALGAPQAAVERFKAGAYLGRSPTLNAFMRKLTDVRVPTAARITLGYGAFVGYQTTQEFIQEAMPVLGDQISAAIREDMPEFDAAEAWGDYLQEMPDIFFAMLWAGLIGGGASTYREFKRDGAFLRTVEELEFVGITGDTARALAAETDPDRATAMHEKAWSERKPEDIKAGIAKLRQKLEEAQVRDPDPDMPTRVAEPQEDGTVVYKVLSKDGALLHSATDPDISDMAYVSISGMVTGQKITGVQTGVAEALEFINQVNERLGRGEDVQKFILDNAGRDLFDQYNLDPTPENFERLLQTVRAFGFDAKEPADLAQFPVLASNQGALVEGIYRSVVRIQQGATGVEVLRDFAQDNLKRALAEQRVSMDWVREQLQKVIPLVERTEVGRRLRAETDTDVIESFSDLAVAYATGKIKDEQLPAGIRGFLRRIAMLMRDIMVRAVGLKKAIAEGAVDQDFEALLASSLGLTDQDIVIRAKEKVEKEINEDPDWDVGPDLSQDGRGPDGLTDDERFALEQELQEMLEEEAEAARGEGGIDILDAVRQAGGLPAMGSSKVYQYAGELKRIREAQRSGNAVGVKGAFNLFRKNAPDLDALIKDLQIMGFRDITTPADLFDTIERRLTSGRKIYGYEGVAAADYSIGTTPRPRRYIPMAQFIEKAGTDLEAVLANAYVDMDYNEDRTALVAFADSRNFKYRQRVPVREFFDWLHSDQVMDGLVFDEEYTPATPGEGPGHTRQSYQAVIDRLRAISLRKEEPVAVERFQWMRNKEGGQAYGNQQIIAPLTEAMFYLDVAPRLRPGYATSLADYQAKHPEVTHASYYKLQGQGEWKFNGAGTAEQLRPNPSNRGWVKPVDSFKSAAAQEQGSTADSEAFPSGRTDYSIGRIAAIKQAVVALHGEAVAQSQGFLADVTDAARKAGGQPLKSYFGKAVKKLETAVGKVDRSPKVPSDLLRATIEVPAGGPAAARTAASKIIEAMQAKGYSLYSPGGQPDITDRHGSKAPYVDIALKFVKDGAGLDPVIKEVLVVQPAMLKAKKKIHDLYDRWREAAKRLADETDNARAEMLAKAQRKAYAQMMKLGREAYDKDSSTLSAQSLSAVQSSEDMSSKSLGMSGASAAAASTSSTTERALAFVSSAPIQGENTVGRPEAQAQFPADYSLGRVDSGMDPEQTQSRGIPRAISIDPSVRLGLPGEQSDPQSGSGPQTVRRARRSRTVGEWALVNGKAITLETGQIVFLDPKHPALNPKARRQTRNLGIPAEEHFAEITDPKIKEWALLELAYHFRQRKEEFGESYNEQTQRRIHRIGPPIYYADYQAKAAEYDRAAELVRELYYKTLDEVDAAFADRPGTPDRMLVLTPQVQRLFTDAQGQEHLLSTDLFTAMAAEVYDNLNINFSIGSSVFQSWFGDSKVVDADGNPLVVYHGTMRPDRVGNRFRKTRATSGPMAFFTASPDIASSYSEGKVDTSLEMPSDYAGWFKYKGKGMRSAVDLDRAWWRLSPAERNTIEQRIYTVGYQNADEATGPIVSDSQSIMGRDSIDYELRQARGNALRALVEIWLNSGSLFNDEQMFMQVLEAAGLDVSRVTYDSPHAVKSAVYPVYLSIQNPLNTADIPADVVSALEQASKRKRAKRSAGGNADAWDKNTISGKDWMAVLRRDLANDGTSAWTRIPDWVTQTLQSLGYDGILDTGGKLGGPKHQVWIPFEETQVKSATGNRGTFDPGNPRIDFSIGSTRGPQQMDLLGEKDIEFSLVGQTDPKSLTPQELAARDAAAARAAADEKDQGGLFDYSIGDPVQLARVEAALDALPRNPSEKAEIYERAKGRLLKLLADNRLEIEMLRAGQEPLREVRRTEILQALGELDAILSVLPPEVRGKVGGFVQLAKIDPMDVYKDGEKVSEARGMAGAIISAWMREGLNIGQAQKKAELPEGYRAERNLTADRSNRALADFFIRRLEKIDKELERTLAKDYRDKIDRMFDRAKAKINESRIRKGRLTPEVSELIDKADAVRALDAEQVSKRVQEVYAQLDAAKDPEVIEDLTGELVLLEMFGNFDKLPSEVLADASMWLEAAVDQGRDIRRVLDEERKARHEQRRQIAVQEFSGGRGILDPVSEVVLAERRQKQKVRQTLYKFHLKNQSFEWLLNAATRAAKDVGTLAGKTTRYFSELVHRATHIERRSRTRREWASYEALAQIFGVKTGLALSRAMHPHMTKVQYNTGVFINFDYKTKSESVPADVAERAVYGGKGADLGFNGAEIEALREALEANAERPANRRKKVFKIERVVNPGKRTEVPLTQDQALYYYMLSQQADVRENLEIHGWTQESFDALEKFLSPETRAIGAWLATEYARGYDEINFVYRQIHFVNMPRVRNYAPVRYRVDAELEENLMDNDHMMSSSSPGFIRQRVRHREQVEKRGALDMYFRHLVDSEHYKAWAIPMQELRAVFGHKNVQEVVKQQQGAVLNNLIQDKIDQFAAGGRKGAFTLPVLDAIRSSFVIAKQSYNWGVMIKQLTSFPAYMYDVPFKDFFRYQAEFWMNPVKNFQLIASLPFVKQRFYEGFDRDMLKVTREFEGLDAPRTRLAKAAEFGMYATKTGDIAPVIVGGFAAYRYKYDQVMRETGDAELARQEAEQYFEMVTERAQQAGDVKDQSFYQSGGSIARMLTMFMTAPRQYYSNVYESMLDFKAGKKGAGAEFARRLFIGQVILPVLFQLAGDLVRNSIKDEDDRELDPMDYLRAIAIGPFNGLFVMGSILDTASYWFIKGRWFSDTHLTGLSELTTRGYRAFGNVGKMIQEGSIEPKEVVKTLDDLAIAASSMAGGGYTWYDIGRRLLRSVGLDDEMGELTGEFLDWAESKMP